MQMVRLLIIITLIFAVSFLFAISSSSSRDIVEKDTANAASSLLELDSGRGRPHQALLLQKRKEREKQEEEVRGNVSPSPPAGQSGSSTMRKKLTIMPPLFLPCQHMTKGANCKSSHSSQSSSFCFHGKRCPALWCIVVPKQHMRPHDATSTPSDGGKNNDEGVCAQNPFLVTSDDPKEPIKCVSPHSASSDLSSLKENGETGAHAREVKKNKKIINSTTTTTDAKMKNIDFFQRQSSWMMPAWSPWERESSCHGNEKHNNKKNKNGGAPEFPKAHGRPLPPYGIYAIDNVCVRSNGGLRGHSPKMEKIQGGLEWQGYLGMGMGGNGTFGNSLIQWLTNIHPMSESEVQTKCFLEKPVILVPVADYRGSTLGHQVFRAFSLWLIHKDYFPRPEERRKKANNNFKDILHLFLINSEGLSSSWGYEIHRPTLYPTWASLFIEEGPSAEKQLNQHLNSIKKWSHRHPDVSALFGKKGESSKEMERRGENSSGNHDRDEVCFRQMLLAEHCRNNCFQDFPDAETNANRYRFGLWDRRHRRDAEFLQWRQQSVQKCALGYVRTKPRTHRPKLIIFLRTKSRAFLGFPNLLFQIAQIADALEIELATVEESQLSYGGMFRLVADADMAIGWVGSSMSFTHVMPAGAVVVEILDHGGYSGGCEHATKKFVAPMWNHPQYLRSGCDFAANNYLTGIHHAIVMLPKGRGYQQQHGGAATAGSFVPLSIWKHLLHSMACKVKKPAHLPHLVDDCNISSIAFPVVGNVEI